MIRIKILSIGKTKERWLEEAIGEYLKRLTGVVSIEFILAKDNEQLISLVAKERGIICLDPEGKMVGSEEFSQLFYKQLEEYGARLTFVIGGAEGLPQALREGYFKLSLSRLTFTHQISRLLLVEQLYRAVEIAKGSNYQK